MLPVLPPLTVGGSCFSAGDRFLSRFIVLALSASVSGLTFASNTFSILLRQRRRAVRVRVERLGPDFARVAHGLIHGGLWPGGGWVKTLEPMPQDRHPSPHLCDEPINAPNSMLLKIVTRPGLPPWPFSLRGSASRTAYPSPWPVLLPLPAAQHTPGRHFSVSITVAGVTASTAYPSPWPVLLPLPAAQRIHHRGRCYCLYQPAVQIVPQKSAQQPLAQRMPYHG